MKKGLLSLISSVAVLLTNAQTDVYLQIHHMLGDAPFAYEATASTNLSEDFQVTRLEYYLSEITLIHDGGQETTIPDLWLLVDAGETVNAFLGSHDITTLESVRFGVGVDQSIIIWILLPILATIPGTSTAKYALGLGIRIQVCGYGRVGR